jgi:hypothetical protein
MERMQFFPAILTALLFLAAPATMPPDLGDGKCNIRLGGDIGYLMVRSTSMTVDPSGGSSYTLLTEDQRYLNSRPSGAN